MSDVIEPVTSEVENKTAGRWRIEDSGPGGWVVTPLDAAAQKYVDDKIGRTYLRYGSLTLPFVAESCPGGWRKLAKLLGLRQADVITRKVFRIAASDMSGR